MVQYNTGILTAGSLVGTELVEIDTGGAVKVRASTAAIAALSSVASGQYVATTILTVGNGTLTGAGLVGGVIIRQGPTAAFTDTTDTAANIVAALGGFASGAQFFVNIKNATSFPQTLSGGTNVTLPPTNLIGPWEEGQYYGTVGGAAAAPTVTFGHYNTAAIAISPSIVSPAAAALNTVGAGTILTAAFAGGLVQRGGSQTNAAFTDTTDTAANIIAGNVGLIGKVGASQLFWYQNTTNATATIAGGTGVTVSGLTTVPANGWVLFLITTTAAATLNMVGVASSPAPSAPNGTFTANGSTAVVVADTRVTANSVLVVGLKTVGGTPAGAPFMSAVTPGTGFSVKSAAGDTSVYNYLLIN